MKLSLINEIDLLQADDVFILAPNHFLIEMMKTKSIFFLMLFTLVSTWLFGQEKQEDWIELFNGKDIDSWIAKIHKHETDVNYANTFRVEDNMIRVSYDAYGETFDDQFGHLYYKRPFSYFRLKLDYRFVGELYPGAPRPETGPARPARSAPDGPRAPSGGSAGDGGGQR